MKHLISAGGVVYRVIDSRVEWLICRHSGYHKWVLPKGIVENGETKEQAAVREVEEECGIVAIIEKPIQQTESYVFRVNNEEIQKTVHYYLMRYKSGAIENHNWEMEDVRWLSFDEAIQKLEYPMARQTLTESANLRNGNTGKI